MLHYFILSLIGPKEYLALQVCRHRNLEVVQRCPRVNSSCGRILPALGLCDAPILIVLIPLRLQLCSPLHVSHLPLEYLLGGFQPCGRNAFLVPQLRPWRSPCAFFPRLRTAALHCTASVEIRLECLPSTGHGTNLIDLLDALPPSRHSCSHNGYNH